MKFKVDPQILAKFPGVRIGVLVLKGIDNTKNKEKIAALLKEEEKKQNTLPSDFRSSIEALLRRVRTGNPLPQINPLVDIYNYLSIHCYVPIGAEDLDKIVGDIELTFAKGDERGKYIGAEEEEEL